MRLLNVRIDPVRKRKLAHALLRLWDSQGQHMIATPNPEMLVQAHRHPEFCEILNRATITVADGIGLQFAGRVLGRHIGERITGIDLLELLAELSQWRGARILLLGGDPGIAPEAARVLSRAFPGLDIQAVDGGWIARLSDGRWIGEHDFINIVKEFEPDVLCIAFGHGKQETWIGEHLYRMPSVKIAVGVGGALDYYAGKVRRAPPFIRRIGLEWLWRLWREPRRWRRIINAVIIFPFLVFRHR